MKNHGYNYQESATNSGRLYYLDKITKPLPHRSQIIVSSNGISMIPQLEVGSSINIFTRVGVTTIRMDMYSPLNSSYSVDSDFYLLLEELSRLGSPESV